VEYKFAKRENYENYASGRVIHGFPGVTNYPVRIASEVFSRCKSYLSKERNIILFDPCCGSAYSLTVLGLLHHDCIFSIYASDINKDVLEIALKNLSLLSLKGLETRKKQIEDDIKMFNKVAHIKASKSIDYFKERIEPQDGQLKTKCFRADTNDFELFSSLSFKADIIFLDVPYGDLVHWKGKSKQFGSILENLSNVLATGGIIAISHDKKQKYMSDDFNRLERLRIGKRIIDIFQLKERLYAKQL